MQQNLLLFIFSLTASLLVSPSKIFEGKKEGGLGYFWCEAALAMGFQLWQGRGGKGEGINGMAEGSADDCI